MQGAELGSAINMLFPYSSGGDRANRKTQMPSYREIECPHCHSNQIVKAGFTGQEKQRYRCKNEHCDTTTFIEDYRYKGCRPEVKAQIIDMAINGRGIRDTARVLKISQWLVMEEIKKKQPS